MTFEELKECLCEPKEPELDEDGNPIEEEPTDGPTGSGCCVNRRDYFVGQALNALIPKYAFRHDLELDLIREHAENCVARAIYIADICENTCGANPIPAANPIAPSPNAPFHDDPYDDLPNP